jgi:hypothetical protein
VKSRCAGWPPNLLSWKTGAIPPKRKRRARYAEGCSPGVTVVLSLARDSVLERGHKILRSELGLVIVGLKRGMPDAPAANPDKARVAAQPAAQ